MNEFMALVKEMRTAQKEYFKLRKAGASHAANNAPDLEMNNPNLTRRGSYNLEERIAEITIAEADGKGFRRSPLFTEEMMGFPFLWTTLPFLSASGAPRR